MRGRRHGARVLTTLLCLSALARAQPTPEDRAIAETLFQDARRLMEDKRYPEACAKLEESQRLAPAGGTLLNLAACHEAVGRIAAAWAEYRDAATQAKKANRKDREKVARERSEALASLLPKLVVVVPQATAAQGVRVQRDGTDIGSGAWGTEIPLDPGPHVVRVTAAGRVPWETKVELERAKVVRVTVPLLEPLPAAAPEPPPVPAPPAARLEPREPAPAAPPRPPRERSHTSTQSVVGVSLIAAGGVATLVGGYFGVRALSLRSQSDDACEGRLCTPDGFQRNEDARSAARLANVLVGLGLIGAGAGVALVLTAPAHGPEVSLRTRGAGGEVHLRW